MRDQVSSVILQIVADGRPGGGTTFVLGLSEWLRERGYKVRLVTEHDSYAAQSARQLGIDVIEFNFFERLNFRNLTSLRDTLTADDIGLIHYHGPRAAFTCCLALNFSSMPLKCIYTVHGYHFRKKSSLMRIFGKFSEYFIQNVVNAVVHVSKADHTFALKSRFTFPRKSLTILNGVDLKVDPPIALDARRFDVVFAARLVVQKNPVFAAKVLLALSNSGLTVCLVGDGDLSPAVQAVLRNSPVKQYGALNHKDTLSVIADSRILLFPSLWEGLPLTPMEAMVCGTVVVASGVDGNNEVVADEITGILIDEFNIENYTNQIRRLLEDRSTLKTMSDSGVTLVVDKFSKQRCFNEYLSLYKRVFD